MSAGNSNGTVGRPFPKGQSGNPRGRPKGFGRKIREKTNGGEEMVDLALEIMRGEITETRVSPKGEPFEVGPSCRERMDAVKWLADRGWGRIPDSEDEEEDETAAPEEPVESVHERVLSLVGLNGVMRGDK